MWVSDRRRASCRIVAAALWVISMMGRAGAAFGQVPPPVTAADIERARQMHRMPTDAELARMPPPAAPHIDALPQPVTKAPVDLEALGRQVPQVNLEIVEPGPEPDAVTMRVHERGIGVTEACGTGACAAAWAAAAWGLARPQEGEITVHMDGGDARVRLDTPAPGRVTLTGPATFVGSIEVDL